MYAIMKRVAIEELYEKGDYYVKKYLKQMQEAKTSFDVFMIQTAVFAEWIKYRFEKLKIDKDLWYSTYKRWHELAFYTIDNPPSPVKDLGARQHKTTLRKIAKKFKVMI